MVIIKKNLYQTKKKKTILLIKRATARKFRPIPNYGDNPRIRETTLFPVCRFNLSRVYQGRKEGYAAPWFAASVPESLLISPSWTNQLDSARFVPEE